MFFEISVSLYMHKVKLARKFEESIHLLYCKIVYIYHYVQMQEAIEQRKYGGYSIEARVYYINNK